MTTSGKPGPPEPAQSESAPAAEPRLTWRCPPPAVILSDGEVHAWSAGLDIGPAEAQQMWSWLSADERARAERFVCEKDRLRFIARRGLLRQILSRYLKGKPEQVRFAYGPQGKPSLAEPRGSNALRFSLSHSCGLALYAVTRLGGIGVDVERIRARPEWEPIVAALFSERESPVFRALPAHQQAEAFFNAWTRKEAFLKATGVGIGESLQRVEVTLQPDERPRLLSVAGELRAGVEWSLRHLTPAPGYVGALAVRGGDWSLACWRWRE